MKTIPFAHPIAATAIAIAMMAQAMPASAVTIQFHDLTDSPTAEAGNAPPLTKVDTCISESSCFVALPNFLQNPSGGYRAQFALTDPAASDDTAGSTSDVIQFSVPLNNKMELDVFLFSDPLTSQIAGLTFFGTADEIGTLQIIPLPGNLPKLATGETLLVEAESDISSPGPEPVPGPSSLLLGIAVLGLGLIRRLPD